MSEPFRHPKVHQTVSPGWLQGREAVQGWAGGTASVCHSWNFPGLIQLRVWSPATGKKKITSLQGTLKWFICIVGTLASKTPLDSHPKWQLMNNKLHSYFYFISVLMQACTSHGTWGRWKLLFLPLHCGFWDITQVYQVWWQTPWPTGPSRWLLWCLECVYIWELLSSQSFFDSPLVVPDNGLLFATSLWFIVSKVYVQMAISWVFFL